MPVGDGGERNEVVAVRRSVVLPAPVDAVWAALTDGGHLSAWLGGDVDVDPTPGGQIVVRDGSGVRRGVVVDLEPGRRLEIRWLPPSRRIGFLWGPDDTPAGSGGGVEFRLEPEGGDSPGDEPEPPSGGRERPGPATAPRTRLTVVERPPALPARRPSTPALA